MSKSTKVINFIFIIRSEYLKSDLSDLCDCFCLQLITDVNIAVAVEAVQAIGNLASGLRTNFSASSRFMLPTLLVSVHFVMFLGL